MVMYGNWSNCHPLMLSDWTELSVNRRGLTYGTLDRRNARQHDLPAGAVRLTKESNQ
jgi:hypothetical protein